jgi:hypothetical protein
LQAKKKAASDVALVVLGWPRMSRPDEQTSMAQWLPGFMPGRNAQDVFSNATVSH